MNFVVGGYGAGGKMAGYYIWALAKYTHIFQSVRMFGYLVFCWLRQNWQQLLGGSGLEKHSNIRVKKVSLPWWE